MLSFSHRRPVRDEKGEVIELRPAAATRITEAKLGGHHGKDRGKRLVVELQYGDVIAIRPERSTRWKKMSALDVYDCMIRTEAAAMARQKRETAKAKKAARLARQRQHRAEQRLFRKGGAR